MKEDKSIFAQGKDNFWKLAMITIVGIVLAGAISNIAWTYNEDFRNKDIALAQYQIMATAKAASISIQEFINNVQANAYAIANDTLMQKGLSENIITPAMKQEVEENYKANEKNIDTVYLLDSKGVILHRHPFWKDGKDQRGNSYADKPGVSHVLKKHESYISKVFYTGSGKLTISVLSPVYYKSNFVGIVRLLTNISTISERFLKPIKVGKKGYAQLLNNRGILLSHSKSEHIGKNIMATRKDKFPDFDWSELEDIVGRMTSGEEGVGIYHSIWWTEKEYTGRVKKLTSFTPIRFGKQLWSIGLTMSYDEIAGPINKNAIITYGFAGILILLFSAAGLAFYKTQKRKAVFEAIAESAEVLRKSEEKYRTLVENAGEAIIVAQDGVIKFTNPKGEELYGRSQEELASRPLTYFIHEEDQEMVGERHKRRLKGEEPPSAYSFRIVDKNGNIKWVELSVVLFSWDHRPATLCFMTDITEKMKIEAQLRQAQKLEALGILAGGLAHDFNNLLAIIVGNICLAKDDIKPEVGISENLTEAEKASLRAKELTKQLITFSKGGEPVKEVSSIGDLVKDTTNLTISGSNARCEFSLPENLWLVKFDENQMKHAIKNLIDNAIESMQDGGSIDIQAENFEIYSETAESSSPFSKGKYIKIAIRDHGVGIPEDHLSMIFDPYFSKKEMGTQKGMGLGLATTYSIINRHNGHISVESEVGVGTTFTLYLPVHEKDVREMELIETPKSEKPEIHTGRILLMDDEKSIRKVAKQMLSRLGYNPDFAKDGAEAIELYKAAIESGKPFDAVILDLTIKGGMGGKDTVKILLEIDPQIRAIVSSGYSNDPVMTNFRKYGFIGALAKPYINKDLNNVISKVYN